MKLALEVPRTLLDLLRLPGPLPLVQAPMAGATSVELVVAVAERGCLGSYPAGYTAAPQVRDALRRVRAATARPFAVNLFAPPGGPAAEPAKVAAMEARLEPFRAALGLKAAPVVVPDGLFAAQLEVVLEERVPIVSFTFGQLPADAVERLKARGTLLVGTATSVREAQALEAAGCDAIVAQGSEAGGHRGTFVDGDRAPLVGSLALVPAVVDAVRVPVVAAGGIMDARGLHAALALGAAGVQLGTAFLTCRESGVSQAYADALRASDETSTVLTRALSGRLARGLSNEIIESLRGADAELPPYPVQHYLTQGLRAAAAQRGDARFMTLWAGQGTRLSGARTVAELLDTLERDLAARALRP